MLSPKRPRVLLLIPHLGGGGAERVAENVARFLDRKKYEVHLGIITTSHVHISDDPSMHICELNTSRISRSPMKLLALIWRVRPSVILSGMAHLNLLVLLLSPAFPRKTRILVRQNGPLSATLAISLNPHLSRLIYGLAYRRADLVICQSQSMKQEIHRELKVDETRLAVLANPVHSDLIRKIAEMPNASETDLFPRLIAIGRMVPEKGFDIALDAFARLSARFTEAELILIGTGPYENSLKQQSKKLGVANRVRFTGHVALPARFFHESSLFVLSSRTESIPNALLEAAAAGLPIVATPASTGLTDLVAKKEGVWLAGEISANALREALESALAIIKPGQRYPHDWIRAFELAHAIPAYEAAIDRAIEGTAS